MSASKVPVISTIGLTKRYGSFEAMRDVDFELRRGEVMGLVGENGAGKSTLVKVLGGMTKQTSGEVLLSGQPEQLAGPAAAEQHGIAVVHQELSLVGNLSVAENILLGHRSAPLLRRPRHELERAAELLAAVGLGHVDPRTPAERLVVAEKQLVEIARVLSRDAQIIVLDEPTASLAAPEIERVEQMILNLAAQGRSLILVTHHLDEIFRVADRVTVMRDGMAQPAASVADLTLDEVVERMLGRPLENMFPSRDGRAPVTTRPVLVAEEITSEGVVSPVSVTVNAGEILGLAGQLGSGASSLLQTLGGVHPLVSGSIRLQDSDRAIGRVGDAIKHGIALCSADRKTDGFFGCRNVRENLTAPALRHVTPGGFRSLRRERALAETLASQFSLQAGKLNTRVEALSGGNQQKVALGKWIGIQPHVLLIDEPTRGVDVGARREIYVHLRSLADEGLAIVFASSDLQEVLGLADRTLTFYRGKMVGQHQDSPAIADVMREITAPETLAATS